MDISLDPVLSASSSRIIITELVGFQLALAKCHAVPMIAAPMITSHLVIRKFVWVWYIWWSQIIPYKAHFDLIRLSPKIIWHCLTPKFPDGILNFCCRVGIMNLVLTTCCMSELGCEWLLVQSNLFTSVFSWLHKLPQSCLAIYHGGYLGNGFGGP